MTCTVPACTRRRHRPKGGRGWCSMHDQRWRLHRTLGPIPRWRTPAVLVAEVMREICGGGMVAEVAERYGVSVPTVKAWCRDWRVPTAAPDFSPRTVAVAVSSLLAEFDG